MKEPTRDGSQARDINKMTGSPPGFSECVDAFKEERLISVQISGQSVVAVSQAFCGHRCYVTDSLGSPNMFLQSDSTADWKTPGPTWPSDVQDELA